MQITQFVIDLLVIYFAGESNPQPGNGNADSYKFTHLGIFLVCCFLLLLHLDRPSRIDVIPRGSLATHGLPRRHAGNRLCRQLLRLRTCGLLWRCPPYILPISVHRLLHPDI